MISFKKYLLIKNGVKMENSFENSLMDRINLLQETCKVNDILLKRYKQQIEDLKLHIKEFEIQISELTK